MSEKLITLYEIKKLNSLLKEYPDDIEFAYALTNTIVDFLGNYLAAKDNFDEIAFNYLVDLLATEHPHLQDRVEKNIAKLMVKKYKYIRKNIILRFEKKLKGSYKERLEKLLQMVFSPLYFSYGYLEPEDWDLDTKS